MHAKHVGYAFVAWQLLARIEEHEVCANIGLVVVFHSADVYLVVVLLSVQDVSPERAEVGNAF